MVQGDQSALPAEPDYKNNAYYNPQTDYQKNRPKNMGSKAYSAIHMKNGASDNYQDEYTSFFDLIEDL